MAARSGMEHLITIVRSWANAGTAEYDDDAIQGVLDRHRADFRFQPLMARPYAVINDERYQDFYYPQRYVEGTASGTIAWRVQDSTGAAIDTADYTVNYDAQHIYFTNDQAGSARYLTGRAYDVHRATAEVWRMKAADAADRFDVKTDNHDLKRSQLYDHYMKQAERFERQAPARVVTMVRSDAQF